MVNKFGHFDTLYLSRRGLFQVFGIAPENSTGSKFTKIEASPNFTFYVQLSDFDKTIVDQQ